VIEPSALRAAKETYTIVLDSQPIRDVTVSMLSDSNGSNTSVVTVTPSLMFSFFKNHTSKHIRLQITPK
jgi:hypothetical protein